MIPLYHLSGTRERPPCGQRAIMLREEPAHKCFGAQVDRSREDGPPAALVLKLDGTRPNRDEPMRCGSCGTVIYPYEIDKLTMSVGAVK